MICGNDLYVKCFFVGFQVGVLYTIIVAGILLRAPGVNAEQRRMGFHTALGYTFLVIPILIFQVIIILNKSFYT